MGLEYALVGESLSRGFGEGDTRQEVLQSVDLQIRRGETVLLMGPSGSGKTTLMALLSGLMRPDSGRVVALGQDLWAMSDRQRENFRLKNCGFIFQGYNLFGSLTARQQLEMVLRWGEGTDVQQAGKRAEDWLEKLGMARRANARPQHLSGGEKQRVAIGRALIKNPTLLFADEPTSALDWRHGKDVIELLCVAAHECGTTVLIVAHDERIKPYVDRVLDMRDGKVHEVEHQRSAGKIETAPARNGHLDCGGNPAPQQQS